MGAAGTVEPFFSDGGFDFYTSPGASIAGCTEHTFVLGRIVVGETNGLNGVQRVLWRELGDVTRTLTGTLTSTDLGAIAGAHVHITNADGTTHFTRATVAVPGVLILPAASSVQTSRSTRFLPSSTRFAATRPLHENV